MKKGVLVKFPNGDSTAVHFTNSDHRSTLNMRATIRRAGLTWPFDHQRMDKRMGLRLKPEQKVQLASALEAVGDGPTSAANVAAMGGVSDPTAKSALIKAGFIQERRGVWLRPQPEPAYPEIERAKTMVAAQPVPVEEAPQERAFIDEVDSWTMPVPKKLKAMADLMGLNIEVRIWRA